MKVFFKINLFSFQFFKLNNLKVIYILCFWYLIKTLFKMTYFLALMEYINYEQQRTKTILLSYIPVLRSSGDFHSRAELFFVPMKNNNFHTCRALFVLIKLINSALSAISCL